LPCWSSDPQYFVTAWSGGRRATIGQRLLKIEVGHAFDGASLTLEQAFRQWLAFGYWLSLFALITVASVASVFALGLWILVLLTTTVRSPTKQGLHDRFARSVVVRPADAPSGAILALMVIATWAAVLWFWFGRP
jgi:uncharacterized RDD family membrane protein YckC